MAPLAAPKQRNNKLHTPKLNALPVKAGANLFTGAIVCTDAAGLAVRGSDTVGLTSQGVCYKGFDNTLGADGVIPGSPDNFDAERHVQVDGAGDWEFAVSAGDPVPGQPAYIVDDDTVSANDTAQSLKIGEFARPGNEGGWFVDVSRR